LTLKIQTADGRRLTFDDSLPRLGVLAQIVCRETLPFLWPQAEAACEAGQTVRFGSIQLDRQGFRHGKQSLRWSQMQKVKVNGAQLLVYTKGKWIHALNVPLSDTPNAHVLLALLGQRVRVERSSK
jgi:hypothetical protein